MGAAVRLKEDFDAGRPVNGDDPARDLLEIPEFLRRVH